MGPLYSARFPIGFCDFSDESQFDSHTLLCWTHPPISVFHETRIAIPLEDVPLDLRYFADHILVNRATETDLSLPIPRCPLSNTEKSDKGVRRPCL
jgi:hypothetical protein